jgi:putative peptide zinc metalloprotease protein
VNEAAGFISKVAAQPGSPVKKGDVLAVFSNPELELELEAAKANRAEMEARLLQAMGLETPNVKPLQSKLDFVQKRIARIEKELSVLTVHARQDGLWVAPSIKEGVGRWLAKGTSLGLIVDPSSFEFVATVLQDDVDQLFTRTNNRAEIRLIGQAATTLLASNLRKIPAEMHTLPSAALGWAAGGDIPLARQEAQAGGQTQRAAEPFFEVRADVQPVAEVTLVHGRTGKIRFDLDSEPLLPRIVRRFRQLLQRRYQI